MFFFQFGKAKVYVNEENDDDDGGLIKIKITKIMMIDIMMMRLLRTPIDPT